MEVRSLGYRTDLMVRRVSGSEIVDRGTHLVVRTPSNPTFYWGNFLLVPPDPVGGRPESWLDAFTDEFPDAGHVAIGVDGTHGHPGVLSEPSLAGLEAEIGTVLTARGLRGPRRPAGPWETRALRTPDDWRQAAQLRGLLDAEDGPVPAGHERFLERVTEEARGTVESGHASYFGAFTDGALCSMVGIVSDGGGVARFQTVGTHPAHRRQGMACTLLVRAARFATAGLGADTLVIVADPDGPAVGLYRSLGFSDAELHFELSRTPAGSPAD